MGGRAKDARDGKTGGEYEPIQDKCGSQEVNCCLSDERGKGKHSPHVKVVDNAMHSPA